MIKKTSFFDPKKHQFLTPPPPPKSEKNDIFQFLTSAQEGGVKTSKKVQPNHSPPRASRGAVFSNLVSTGGTPSGGVILDPAPRPQN